MRAIATAAILLALAGPASADSWKTAQQLGTVLGSENACGLVFDQAAIVAYIEANVAADDMEFPTDLQDNIDLAIFDFGDMTATARLARCAQVTRIARSLGFVE